MSETKQSIDRARVRVRNYLQSFVFFHLGADAELAWQREEDEVEVKLSHPRIDSLSFRMSRGEVLRFASSESEFEEFLLRLLTRYRRS